MLVENSYKGVIPRRQFIRLLEGLPLGVSVTQDNGLESDKLDILNEVELDRHGNIEYQSIILSKTYMQYQLLFHQKKAQQALDGEPQMSLAQLRM